jgi:A/G-specific adenine glycosylase
MSDFIQLPGVGDYIASAVQSIAFGYPKAVVDGNVKRVLARLFQLKQPVNKSCLHQQFSEIADQLLETDKPGIFNQALMELGALVCKPRNPLCKDCPAKLFCWSFGQQTVDLFPKRVKNKKVPEYRISAGVVLKKGRFLITQRKSEGLLGGLWEFPGGKIRKGEKPETACVREIMEETSLVVQTRQHITLVRHAYTHFKIKMDVYLYDFISGRVKLNGPVDFRWISLKEIEKYPFPKANHKFFPALKKIMDTGLNFTQNHPQKNIKPRCV